MEPEKSSIDSFDVSLGSAGSPQHQARGQLQRWNILVCSDLGYTSLTPVQVRISEWNEFMASKKILLCGAMVTGLAADAKQAFAEIPVQAIKDFSAESITANVPPFRAFSRASFALKQLLDGKTNPGDASAMIKKAGLPPDEEARALSLAASGGSEPSKPTPARPKNTSIDSILSMVEGPSAKSDAPLSATDALFTSVVGDGKTPLNTVAIAAYVRAVEEKIRRQFEELARSPFFAFRKDSWQRLMGLAKTIGRSREVVLSVVSAAQQDMEESIADVLASCMESGFCPDMVVWDYATSFSNASMEAAGRLAQAAEQYKCVAVAPLTMNDPLMEGISQRSSIAHIMEEVRFLPYKKLRSDPASRCLCLCGPDLARSDAEAPSSARCCWFVATRWVEMLLSSNDPFTTKGTGVLAESSFQPNGLFAGEVSPSVAQEAAQSGISLFEKTLREATLDKTVTVIGKDHAAESYTSFLFNMAVNRTIRLAGIRLLAAGSQKSKADVAGEIGEFLRAEMLGCGLVNSADQVTAAAEGDAIAISIHSDVTVSGFPIDFTFSF